MKRRATPRVRVAVILMLGATLAVGAAAQQSSPSATATATTTPSPTRKAAPPVEVPAHIQAVRTALTGMLVAIDPATGTLRAPNAEEVDALTGMTAAARFAEPAAIDLPGGASAVLTSPMNVDLLTVTRRADGSMAYTCTHGIDAASTTFAADHRRIQEEPRDDR